MTWRSTLLGSSFRDGQWCTAWAAFIRSAQSTDLVPSFDIQIKLDAVGGALLRRLTATHLNQSLAVVVEGTIVAAPIICSEFGEDFVITGNFSKAAAEKLAATIRKPDPRRRATYGFRFADAKTALAALKEEAARRKLRGFEATIDPRLNSIAITAADADTQEALKEILDRSTLRIRPNPHSTAIETGLAETLRTSHARA